MKDCRGGHQADVALVIEFIANADTDINGWLFATLRRQFFHRKITAGEVVLHLWRGHPLDRLGKRGQKGTRFSISCVHQQFVGLGANSDPAIAHLGDGVVEDLRIVIAGDWGASS